MPHPVPIAVWMHSCVYSGQGAGFFPGAAEPQLCHLFATEAKCVLDQGKDGIPKRVAQEGTGGARGASGVQILLMRDNSGNATADCRSSRATDSEQKPRGPRRGLQET